MTLTNCVNENLGLSNQDASVANAKKWFDLNKPSLTVLDYTQTIDWTNAIVSNGDKGIIIEVPLILKGNITAKIGGDQSYQTYNRIMFVADKQETYKAYHVLITTNDIAFDNTNKNCNFYNLNTNFNGYITVVNVKKEITDFNTVLAKDISPIAKTSKLTLAPTTTCVILVENFDDGSTTFIASLGCFGGGGGGIPSTGYAGTPGKGGTDPVLPVTVTKTPCDVVKGNLSNTDLQAKLIVLKTTTSLHYESGFMQNMDGTFVDLKNDGAHALHFPFSSTSLAFFHNHNDNYESEPNDYGETAPIKPIRMFSPDDIKSFLILLANTNRYGNPLDSVSGNMTISGANYSLTFSGDIKTVSAQYFNVAWGTTALEDTYKVYMKNDNKEESLLNFIKDIVGIAGINLTRIDANGVINNLTLDSNNKLVATPCK